jgi:hypothetical protein
LSAKLGRKRWGDEGYAMEELVAEFGSAFISANLDLTPELRNDHAAYIASWLKVLKNDKRAIFTAVSHAQPPPTKRCARPRVEGAAMTHWPTRRHALRRPSELLRGRARPLRSLSHGSHDTGCRPILLASALAAFCPYRYDLLRASSQVWLLSGASMP